MNRAEETEIVKKMVLYAWVGEDELGSGKVGLKQGLTLGGLVPLVACEEGKVDQDFLIMQLRAQSSNYGKPIHLCRFVYEKELMVLEP